jgi:hypothetical protein
MKQPSEMKQSRERWQRLAWFIAIWACSVAALGVVAGAIRLALRMP